MKRDIGHWIALPAFALLLLPAGSPAQVSAWDPPSGRSETAGIAPPLSDLAAVTALRVPLLTGAPQPAGIVPKASDGGMSRRAKVIIGAVIGGAGGVVVGEYWFGQGLDMPHGLDMAVGAGLGAGIGALVGLIVDVASPRDGFSRDVTLSVMPDLMGGGASALVTVPVR